jgi:hypothetical protein
MPSTITAAEAARIEALLARLDPEAHGACEVQGCVHVHHGSTDAREGVAALAA